MLKYFYRLLRAFLRQMLLLPISMCEACRDGLLKVYSLCKPNWETVLNERLYRKLQDTCRTVHHVGSTNAKPFNIKIQIPNAVCRFRADTFSTKEPETLAWIETYGGAGAFFDIGANVGLYSIYYGLVNEGHVYSFEPSVFNLRLLAQNISQNNLQEKINIIPNPLSNTNGFSNFRMQNTDEGGALSAFGVDYGHTGKTLDTHFSFRSCGFTLDFMIESKIITEIPRLIKIDVDGIEHLILEGAYKTLRHPSCISVLIEVNKDFHVSLNNIKTLLGDAGFHLLDQNGWEKLCDKKIYELSPNQIWVKK